jgi:hypothetical protein
MKVHVLTLQKLLAALSQKTGKTLDYAGLKDMSETIGDLGSDYLYKKILQEIKSKGDDELHGIGAFQLTRILNFLGFNSLQSFEDSLNNPLNDQLQSLAGNYYSYVRANHVQGVVLRSPVRIYREESKMILELKGKDQLYHGTITEKEGCLFILMTSGEGKSFHHVYKIGSRKFPKVLQGVFSGVSTAFDPIGGRTVLIRQEASFDTLTNRKEKAEVMIKSADVEETRVGSYFQNYYNNNLSPSKSSDFGYDDLT